MIIYKKIKLSLNRSSSNPLNLRFEEDPEVISIWIFGLRTVLYANVFFFHFSLMAREKEKRLSNSPILFHQNYHYEKPINNFLKENLTLFSNLIHLVNEIIKILMIN